MDPFYDLDEIQRLISEGRYRITLRARYEADSIEFDPEDVCECILALSETHFYKPMPAIDFPGLWQDVYKRCI